MVWILYIGFIFFLFLVGICLLKYFFNVIEYGCCFGVEVFLFVMLKELVVNEFLKYKMLIIFFVFVWLSVN